MDIWFLWKFILGKTNVIDYVIIRNSSITNPALADLFMSKVNFYRTARSCDLRWEESLWFQALHKGVTSKTLKLDSTNLTPAQTKPRPNRNHGRNHGLYKSWRKLFPIMITITYGFPRVKDLVREVSGQQKTFNSHVPFKKHTSLSVPIRLTWLM